MKINNRSIIKYAALLVFWLWAVVVKAQSNGGLKKWHPLFSEGNYQTVFNKASDSTKSIFQVEDNEIKVLYNWGTGSASPFGMLVSNKKFKNYNLELEYKWGLRKFKPRETKKRDAGVMLLVQSNEKVWPPGIEYQIQEGDVGDVWAIEGVNCAVRQSDSTIMLANKPYSRFPKIMFNESPGWNKIRIEARGNHLKYFLNGKLVNEVVQANYQKAACETGSIAIQAEYAEITYRNIIIQELNN